jgi:hypothetical protein
MLGIQSMMSGATDSPTLPRFWQGRGDDQVGAEAHSFWAEQLRLCYSSALDAAHRHGVTSLAVPLLGAGARGAPPHEAALVAASAVAGWRASDEGALPASAMKGWRAGGRAGRGGDAGESRLRVMRLGVQDSTTAHMLAAALDQVSLAPPSCPPTTGPPHPQTLSYPRRSTSPSLSTQPIHPPCPCFCPTPASVVTVVHNFALNCLPSSPAASQAECAHPPTDQVIGAQASYGHDGIKTAREEVGGWARDGGAYAREPAPPAPPGRWAIAPLE